MFPRQPPGRRSARGERIFVTLQRGDRVHCLGVRPGLFWLGVAVLPGCVVLGGLAGAAVLYRDDLVSGLVSHERAIVEHYERELATQRATFDATREAGRREKEALDARLRDIANRQAALEARDARVAALGSRLVGQDVTGSIPTAGRTGDKTAPSGALSRLLRFGAPKNPPLPSEASAYAPTVPDAPAQASRPTPTPLDITPADEPALPKKPDRRAGLDPAALDRDLELFAARQTTTVAALQSLARRHVGAYEAVFARIGLDPARLRVADKTVAGGQGGPLVPVSADDLAVLESHVAKAERLARLVARLPLAAPADGALEMTSPFGVRTDPFNGSAAMHTGLDLREEPGAAIYATAAGRVTVAETAGGYGNMVEIDHGNGLRTRYGHLSSILVHDDQWVEAGATIGRAGSTGRSTGTHLHYEVRVDGEPIDPVRYLEAGAKLAEAKL